MKKLPVSILTKSQKKVFGPKRYTKGADSFSITAFVRYDDECGNGHNTFSITADIRMNGMEYMGGCCHEEVAKHFPELAPFIKWHLVNSDGPSGYPNNTIYFAGDRDCWGLRKGEFRQHTSRGPHQNGGVAGVPNWELRFPEDMKRDVYSNTKPSPVTLEWQPHGMTGEGKDREFDNARSSAVWPTASNAELMSPDLENMLMARLPALIEEFKFAVESLGFVF
jgi:hypothetical protein